MSEMRIYVGTYAKYNSGSLDGKWFDLDDYADRDEFYEACQAFHDRNNPKDEDGDPIPSEHEFMFQDWEGIPSGMIGECSVDEGVWELAEAFDKYDEGAVRAFLDLFDGTWDEDKFNECYHGEYSSWINMAEEWLEETGELNDIPEHLRYYFDYEAYARDMRLGGDMCEQDGHFFWNR